MNIKARHRLLLSIGLAGLFCARILAAQVMDAHIPPGDKRLSAPHVDFEKYTLRNGLQVILFVDRRVPTVHVNLWYHVGSKNERQDRDGFAHLFEHMMYQGSKNANAEYGTLIEKAGGSTNANPDEDRTEFFETVPSGSLEYVLWLESDRLATLPDALTQERLDNQKSVVENERRQRLENQPYGLAGVLINENLYPANHPYSHSIIGSHDDVRAATIPEVKDFFSTYYAPNNLSMVIAGDFDVAATKQWIAKYFGPIPPGIPFIRPARWTPHLSGEKIIDVSDHVAEERAYFAWTAPPYLSADNARLELAARILSRRLSADLVYSERPLCSEVTVELGAHEDASNFVIMASAHQGGTLAEIEHKVEAEIAALAKDGPKPDELQQAKSRVEYGELSQFDTLQSTAETLNKGNVFAGDPAYYAEKWKQIDGMTAEEVASVMRQVIDTEDRLLVRFHPESFRAEAQAENLTPLDRSVPPQLHQDFPLHAPKVASTQLSNGLQIFVAQRSDIPKVSVLLVSRAGVMCDPPGKDGLAVLTVTTMTFGTSTRTGTQIRDGMESASATTISQSVSSEAAGLGFDVLSAHIEPAFGILADVALHPAFKQYSFDTNRQQLQDAGAQSRTDAGDIAGNVMPGLIFGADHPYARPIITQAGLGNLHREDLNKFYQTYWKPDDSALFFAGDISLEAALNLAQEYFGTWSGNAAKAAPVSAPEDAAAGRIYLIDKPDAPQTLLVQTLPAVGANSPDRFPLSLATTVWGGMFGSRLSMSLREKQGYTYGFSSSMGLFSDYGTWSASGSVQTDKTKESIAELERQLRLLKDRPISATEVQEARKTSLRNSAADFETSASIVSRMGQLWTWHLPMSALQGESDGVQEASLTAVRDAVARYADPAKATLLLIGDRSRIEAGVRELNLGEVILLDADGQPVASGR